MGDSFTCEVVTDLFWSTGFALGGALLLLATGVAAWPGREAAVKSAKAKNRLQAARAARATGSESGVMKARGNDGHKGDNG
jgi:hypothetical protein